MPFSNSFIEQLIKVNSETTLARKNIHFFEPEPAFLSSFPRSGNGWVRLVFAAIILEINDIDVNTINILRKKTSGGVQYISLNSNHRNFDLEDIFPDIYLLDTETNQKNKSNDVQSLKIPVTLIKTHQIVDCNSNKALFLFREPISCLTSAALLLNGEAIKSNPIKINETVRYLSKYYAQMLQHYLEQKKHYPDSCFFLHHGFLSDEKASSYFVDSFRFLAPDISVDENLVQKVLKKFPLKSGYSKILAQNVTHDTNIFVKDLIQNSYEKALKFGI